MTRHHPEEQLPAEQLPAEQLPAAGPTPRRAWAAQDRQGSRLHRGSDAALACILGFVFLAATVPMGLCWGGWTYTAAVTQGALAIFLTAPTALLARRSWWAYLVPLVSALLTVTTCTSNTSDSRAS